MPRKPEFSPTRIRTFLTCPMMYRLEYVERVGRFYHKAKAGYSFGTSLHQALQTFHESGGAAEVTPEALQAHLETTWIPQGYATAEAEQEHKEEALRILTDYHEQATARAEETRTFLTEKMLKWDLGPFVLTGRIDRIDEHAADGALEIVDYKSGRFGVTEEDVRGSLAMSIYQVLAKRSWPDRRVSATIHALRSGSSATVSLTDNELAQWETDLRELGTVILETDFEAVRPVPLPDVCPDCDFLKLCSRQWRREGRNYRAELSAASAEIRTPAEEARPLPE